ncbi:MAG: sensor histidine kinase [Haloarculaceae archaeon]
MKRQRRRLSEFASTVSHDLRNPLMVVRGRVELLDEDASDSQIETIERNLDRMEAIIEDTVTVAREGQPVEETEPVDVGSVAETCWQHLDTGSATLDLDGEVTVDADADRLDRLFEHLFDNVVEHGSTSNRTRSDSAVTVTVGALAGDVDGFYVEDDGPGIPADERDRVFEPGYTTAGERTGFGLCIVRELAEAHGWAVSLVEGSDGGARFEFAADAGARFARP